MQQGQPHAGVFQSSGVSVAPPPMMTYTTNVTSQPGQPPMQVGCNCLGLSLGCIYKNMKQIETSRKLVEMSRKQEGLDSM